MIKRRLLILAIVLLAACQHNTDTPKPQAYIRIDTPQHSYHTSNELVGEALPFSFDVDNQAQIVLKKMTARDIWVDIEYPQWDGVVFLSYKSLTGKDDLRGQTDTSQRLLEKHYLFTSGIEEQQYTDPESKVYGKTYRLHGNKVASTYQFWVTDSTHHFLRGALYLDKVPNNDSLAPVIDYIQEDMDHLVETLRWR